MRWSSCVKKKKKKGIKMPSFLLMSCNLFFLFYFIFTFLLEVCILVHGAEKSSILSLEQNDTKLLPSRVTVTCVVHREGKTGNAAPTTQRR